MTVTLIRALLIYFTVILAMRIMGKRQIGELNPHELVITILVSQIASIPLQDNSMPLANAFLPMLLLVSLEILASVASMKSLRLRNLLQGRPIFLIRHGKPDQKQMRRLRFTVDDLIDALRQKDVFDLSTVEEAVVFFANQPKIARKLQTLLDVGLGYVTLGQSATTLSGGEAQRVKLANELARRSTGKTVYILDEPTTGLHIADVHRLIEVLQKLVDAGNTVIVIEHNLDLIKCADHIIDLGPEGGSAGGLVIAEGTPEQVAEVPGSFTGQYLKPLLEKDAKLRTEGK